MLPRAVLSCLLIVAAIAGASAQGSAPVVAIVDFPAVVRDSLAMTAVRRQVDGLQQTHESEVRSREQRLRDLDQSLAAQRDALGQEAFEQKRREFEREFVVARNAVQERQQRMERAYAAALREIEKKIIDVTFEIAREQDIAIVFGRNAIVIAETSFDISDQVLNRLDRELPSVTVQLAN